MPDRYNRSGGPNDAYSRGARDLDKDRNALFAGASVKPSGPPGGRFQNGPADGGDGGAGGGGDEDDMETLKTQTKDIKQQSVQSTREALRLMREAQETGVATMDQLGKQSGKLISGEYVSYMFNHCLRTTWQH